MSIDAQTFQFGDWHVNPSDNSISRDAQSSQMEPRAMDVLVALCREPNTIISAEQLLAQCWGSTLYGDNPVHKTIAQLRKLLGDQSSAPVYIETIRKRGYRTLALVQFDTAEDALAGTWISGSPFRGLQSFNEEHASIFFGRSDAVYYLSQQLIQQTSHAAPVELFLILGPSGSGKTSLLQAGLIPSLMTKNSALQLVSHSSFDLAERADHGLMTLLAGMLLDLEMNGQGLFPRHSAHSLGLALEDDLPTILTTLRLSLNQVAQIAPTKTYRYALFLDRFEAIFDECSISITERECFLKLLDKLARSQSILVLLACRNDFYPQIAASPLLMEAKKRGAHFDLFAPSHAEIAQMIRRPALAANLTFGIDEQSKVRLDDVLCQVTINNPDALPLLQYTLNELYRLRTASGELSFAAFHQLGGIEGAIGRRAEQVISQLTEAQRQCLPQILSLVTTISNSDNIITSRRAAWTQLSSDDARILVTALVESRLFVSELVDGASGFGIAHEALLRRWSRVTDWIASHRHALQVRARIGEMALRWEAEARNKDLLLPEGKQLNEACDLLKLTSFSLTSLELALVSASASNMSARKRTRQIAWGGICTLVILTAGLALSALNANRQAIERPVVVERLMSTMLSEASAIGKLSLSDSARSEALAYFTKTSEQELSQVELAQRPKTLLALAELSAKRGESQAALAAWQAASAIYAKQLAVYPNDKNIITNLGEITLSIAQRHFFENNFNKAELAFRQALTYGNQLLQLEPGSLVSLNTSARAHQGLGNVAVQNGQFKVAESIFEQLTKLRTEELAFNPSDNKLKSKRNANLIDALFSLGTVKKAQGEFTAALKLHQTESAIASESYKAEPNDDLWAFRWAKSLHEQAENSLALGRDKVALKYLAQAEKLYEKIVLHEPANHGWFSALTNTKILSQDIYARLENSAANSRNILTHLHKINAELQQLGLMNPKGDLWQTQVWNQLNGQLQASIVTRLLEMKQDIAIKKSLDQAGENLISAERYLTEQLELYPFDHRAKFLLADAMIAHAAFEHYRQNDAAARQTCQRGHDLLEERVTNSLDFEILLRWIQLNICLGNTEKIASTKQSLAKIGYLDTAYLHIIAHQ